MDINAFIHPPKSARPLVRWWWTGLDVEKEELLRELDDLDRSGLGGAELQPFLIGSPPNLERKDPKRARRTHRFMQPFHYEMMSAVLDGAEQRGLTIDITQNSAWPTGGTHISLEDSHQTLLFGETAVKGPRVYDGPVPRLKPLRLFFVLGKLLPVALGGLKMITYIPEDKKLVRVVAGRLEGKKGKFTSWKIKQSALLEIDSMVDLTGSIDSNGILHWEVPPGNWQLFAFYEGSAGVFPLMDARSEPGKRALVVDHFNRAAVQRHLDAFIGQGRQHFGRHFGKTFRAIFTDSFELISPMHWKIGFLEEFQRRRGYDVTPYLPVTYVPLKDVGYYTYGNELNLPNFDFAGDAGKRIRYDFQRTISDLFIDEFISGAADWCEENGIQSRVQGYGMLADPLRMLGCSHIPETEQLYGGGALHFLKLAGSAASLYNRKVVTSETLVWSGRHYMTTPLKWRVGLDRLYESGINQAIYHGFPYRHPAFPYPGFQPFASPYMPGGFGFSSDMSRDNPLLFGSAPYLNAYAARAQYLLQRSKTRAAVGIFYQLFDYPNGNYIKEELVQGVLDESDAQLPKAGGLAEMIMPTTGDVTGERLWVKECAALGSELVANGWYYQFFNEDSLLKATLRDGKVQMGEAEFSALLLFKETALPAAAALKLRQLAESGVPVLLIGIRPQRDPGFFEHEARDEQVREALAGPEIPLMQDAAGIIEALRERGVLPQVAYSSPQPGIGFIHTVDRETGEERFFLRNRARREQAVELQLQAGERMPVELDLWSGAALRLPYEAGAGGQARLSLTFGGYTSRMLALMDAEEAARYPMADADLREGDLEAVQVIEQFSFTAEQRLADGSKKSLALENMAPVDWRSLPELAGLGSPGTYQARFTLENVAPGERYFLCFERIGDRADIIINGAHLAPLLVMPWRCEVTGMVQAGENTLSVQVTPALRNALVGYGNSGAPQYKQYKKLVTMPAGLIGPVRVCRKRYNIV